MSRVKRGVAVKARHKRVLNRTRGYRGGRSKLLKLARQASFKAGLHAYRDRKRKKRTFRQLWNVRISAAVKPVGMNYSRFIHQLFQKQVILNRKMLSEIAFQHPEAFQNLVSQFRKE